MKFDDASWHYGGDFDSALPPAAGATHIGMFCVWAMFHGMGNPEHGWDISALKGRTLTPAEFVMNECDEKFVADMLNHEGIAFASDYYDHAKGAYLADYEQVLGADLPTLYHVPDSWESYDKLEPTITKRYLEWKNIAAPTQSSFLNRLKGLFRSGGS